MGLAGCAGVETTASRALSRLREPDRRLVDELARETCSLRLDRPANLNGVGEQLAAGIGLARFMCYTLAERDGRLGVTRWDSWNVPNRIKTAFAGVVDAPAARFGCYDPLRPEPAQQNRPFTTAQMTRRFGPMSAPMKSMFRATGLEQLDQLRVLLCEHGTLLAWFGGFREEPFGTREQHIFEALAPSLCRRLSVEHRLSAFPLQAAALEAALDSIPEPAVLTDAKGSLLAVNVMARKSLDEDGASFRQALLRALKRQDTRANSTPAGEFALTPLGATGLPPHFLAVRRGSGNCTPHLLAQARKRWGLTPRQAEVLGLMARGLSNRGIAAKLRLREGTVELHVGGVLRRSGSESRASVVARFWTEL